MKPRADKMRRLIVPLVLTVTIIGTAAAVVSASSGCGHDKPKVDAGLGDGGVDTPIV